MIKSIIKRIVVGLSAIVLLSSSAINVYAKAHDYNTSASLGTIYGDLNDLSVDDVRMEAFFSFSTSCVNANITRANVIVQDAIYGNVLSTDLAMGNSNGAFGCFDLASLDYFGYNNGYAAFGAHDAWDDSSYVLVYTANLYN